MKKPIQIAFFVICLCIGGLIGWFLPLVAVVLGGLGALFFVYYILAKISILEAKCESRDNIISALENRLKVREEIEENEKNLL